MADRPILFSAPMVRALLEGRKTQTRRILKPLKGLTLAELIKNGDRNGNEYRCTRDQVQEPRFAVGDRLYVREHWRTCGSVDSYAPRHIPSEAPVFYEADEKTSTIAGRHRQAMHMPRWASRLTLIVTDVRVERLQDISESDALAEGIERIQFPERGDWGWPQRKYREIWENINGHGSWDQNPWIVAVSFEVIKQNIDEVV